MLSFIKWALPTAAAMGLLFVAASKPAQAEDKPAVKTGSVTVTVLDKDGKAVADATVAIVTPPAAKPAADGKATNLAEDPAPAPADKPKPGAGRGNRPAPIKEGKTDADGKVTLADIPAGEYMVRANLRPKGMAREALTIKAGETVTITLTLKEMAPRGGAAPGAAGK